MSRHQQHRPLFYQKGQNRYAPIRNGSSYEQQRQRKQPIVQVHNILYAKLLDYLREKYGQRITRRENVLYTVNDFLPVAEIRSAIVVSIYLIDAASGKIAGKRDERIEDLKIPPPITVARELYGYLRRHITNVAGGAETWRRGNRFYTNEGRMIAELVSSERVRIHHQTGEGLFTKNTTDEIVIAELKPKKIEIPRELLYITKKLFGSYRRFDRGVRMDYRSRISNTPSDTRSSSLIDSLASLPECAKAFFGKATNGLIEAEVKYLLTKWAGDLKNNRRARTNNRMRFSVNEKPQENLLQQCLAERPRPAYPLIEMAEIVIDEEPLTGDERCDVMRRLGLEAKAEEQCLWRRDLEQITCTLPLE